mmetsp:Transcript_8394/g.19759  ORF Transcript_8394/g.19759 Transcript_8394/m.19759 type:complete len:214 (-) Transcript_8394:77-718(-)
MQLGRNFHTHPLFQWNPGQMMNKQMQQPGRRHLAPKTVLLSRWVSMSQPQAPERRCRGKHTPSKTHTWNKPIQCHLPEHLRMHLARLVEDAFSAAALVFRGPTIWPLWNPRFDPRLQADAKLHLPALTKSALSFAPRETPLLASETDAPCQTLQVLAALQRPSATPPQTSSKRHHPCALRLHCATVQICAQEHTTQVPHSQLASRSKQNSSAK